MITSTAAEELGWNLRESITRCNIPSDFSGDNISSLKY